MRISLSRVLGPSLVSCLLVLGGCEEEEVDPASLPSTDRPDDAVVLDRSDSPETIVFEVKANPASRAFYIDMWISDRGWQGEVLKVRRKGGMTIFSLRVDDSTVPGDIVIYAEAPGDDLVKVPGLVRIRGRISDVEISDRVDIRPHRVLLDRVKIMRFSGG